MAEGAGFEPALGGYPKHAFQACDLNRSSTLPNKIIYHLYVLFFQFTCLIYGKLRFMIHKKSIWLAHKLKYNKDLNGPLRINATLKINL